MTAGIEVSVLQDKTTGTSRYITCLIEQLKTFDNKVITFPTDSFIKFPFLKKAGARKFLYRHFLLRKGMKNAKIDYAFFPDYFMPPDFTIPSAVVIHDLSFISHQHLYPKSFVSFYRFQLKQTLKNNPLIITISESTRSAIIKYLGIKRDNIHLVQAYSTFNIEEARESEHNYLLYVGHIEPRKNIYFLINTFLKWKEMTGSDLKLVIAGEFWIKTSETRRIFAEFKNHRSIEFTGYINESKLKKLYNDAAGFINVSFVEGFCMPVLEAMHYKLPLICPINTGAEEISKPYSVIINPCSEKSLLEGLNKLDNKIHTERFIDYKIKYSPALMRNQLAEVIDKLESGRKTRFSITVPAAKDKEEAVEKTLLYACLFKSGIKKENIRKSLFDVKISKEELERILLKLYLGRKIYFRGDSVFLNYKSPVDKSTPVKSDYNKLKKALSILNFIPFISSASFSGGTAHYGLENHNDIDLFIITKPNTLYIVYTCIHFLSLMFRVRNELCANYLIDERKLEIKEQQDFFTAHQIISLKAFKNKELLDTFFSKNIWIKKYFPNFEWCEIRENKPEKNILPIPVNYLLKHFYRFLYRKKLKNQEGASVKIDDFQIKLHTNDHRQRITTSFLKLWEEYKSGFLIPADDNRQKEKAAV